MKKELFINHVKKKGIIVIHTSGPDCNFNACMLNDFRRVKSFFQYIDFDCQINPEGGCRKEPNTIRCCCSDCFGSIGYFRRLIDKDISRYSKIFSVKTGFWREGKGCILPHKMRSVTCLAHHCNYDGKHQDFGFGIMHLRDKLEKLRGRI